MEESVRSLVATWAGCDMLEAAKFQPVRWASLIVSTLAIIFSWCDDFSWRQTFWRSNKSLYWTTSLWAAFASELIAVLS